MRFIKSVSISYITQIIIILISIVTSIVTARYLGPSGRGIFAVLAVISGVSMQIGNLGFPASNIYFLGKSKDSSGNIVGISLIVGLFGGAIISFFLFFLFTSFPDLLKDVDINLLIITLISLPFLFSTSLFSSIVLGFKKYLPYNLFQILNKNLSLFKVLIILIVLGLGIKELIVGTTIVSIIIFFTYFVYISRKLKIELKFNKKLFFEMWNYGKKSYLASTLGFLIIRSDIFLINYFLGSTYTGLYSISVALIDLFYLLPGTIGTILFSTVAGGSTHEFTTRVFKYTFYLMLILSIFGFFLAKPLILLMYGNDFYGSIPPFLILLPGIVFLGTQTILMQDLAGRGLPRIVYISPAISLFLNIIMNLIMIPLFKINGAAISSSICYGVMLLLILRKHFSISNQDLYSYIFINRQDINYLRDTIKDILRLKI